MDVIHKPSPTTHTSNSTHHRKTSHRSHAAIAQRRGTIGVLQRDSSGANARVSTVYERNPHQSSVDPAANARVYYRESAQSNVDPAAN